MSPARILKSNFFKNISIYTTSNIIEKGLVFLLLPVLARMLSEADVGYFTLSQAILVLLVPFFTLSIDASIILNFFKVDKNNFKIYFSNGLFLFFIFFTSLILISLLFREPIAQLLAFPVKWLYAIIAIVFLQFFNQLRCDLWRMENEAIKYAVFSTLLSFVKNISGLSIILLTDLGWKGVIIGYLSSQLIFAVFSVFTFFKEKRIVLEYSKEKIVDIVKVGAPLSLHRFGAWLSDSLNRFVINALVGIAATGSYGIGATFGMFLTVCQDAFNKAYVPYLFENLAKYSEKVRLKLVKITFSYYGIILLFALGISTFGFFTVDIFFGLTYEKSKVVIAPLVFAAAFNGLYKMHVNYIFFTKNTHIIMYLTLSLGMLNIFLVYLLVTHYGILGAAYATLIIQLISFLITFYISNRLIPIFLKNRIRDVY